MSSSDDLPTTSFPRLVQLQKEIEAKYGTNLCVKMVPAAVCADDSSPSGSTSSSMSPLPELAWIEVTKRSCEVYPESGPWHSVRLIVGTTVYRLQVTWPVVRVVSAGVYETSEQLDPFLQQLLPDSGYTVCPGIVNYDELFAAVRHTHQNLQTIKVGEKVVRHESVKCMLWHKPEGKQKRLFDRKKGMCAECKSFDYQMTREVKRATQSEPKVARTASSSNYPFTYLSPASQKVRARNLMRERKTLMQRIQKYASLCVPLDDEQSEEMSSLTQAIDGNPEFREELNNIFLEADHHREGHGATLQEIWESDVADNESDKFQTDQGKNSMLICIVYNTLILTFAIISVCREWWSW